MGDAPASRRKVCRSAYDVAFGLIAEQGSVATRARSWKPRSSRRSSSISGPTALITDGPPIVGVGPHSGDPHYETTPETDTPIKLGGFRAGRPLVPRINHPRAVYADYTRMGFVGEDGPPSGLRGPVRDGIVRARDAGARDGQATPSPRAGRS